MRLLDVFCGAGGCSEGYRRAGFTDIVGVDLSPQPRYPFTFVQGDALEFLRSVKPGDFDCIHASPPCQAHSRMGSRWQDREHADLIAATRAALKDLGTPYVIENVPPAPLVDPLLLCGTMFGLRTEEGSQLRRHRLFECPGLFALRPRCQHRRGTAITHEGKRRPATIGVWGNAGGFSRRDGLDHYDTASRAAAMGIDWMTVGELSQAIPPAFTEWIGRQLLAQGDAAA